MGESWCQSWTEVILKKKKLYKENVSAYQCETKLFKTNKKQLGFKVTSVQAVLKIATLLDLFPHKLLLIEMQYKSIVDHFITNLLSASQQTA